MKLCSLDKSQLREDERRREPRFETDGSIEMVVEASATAIHGELIDVSRSGFRVAHSHLGLRSGQVVSYRRGTAAGKARIIWNLQRNNSVQSGLVTLRE